jgi:DNA-binding FadR family transcriptional regulator
VSDTKLAVKIADQIEREIIDQGWSVGTMIGSEKQLLERFKVSRAVLRESVLILEQRQIARRQRGLGGGVIVRAPSARSVSKGISLFLEFTGVTAEDLLEARMLLEGHCAAKAALTASPQRARELRTHAQAGLAMKGEDARQQMGQFHVLLAQLSDNPVWSLVTEALVEAAASLLYKSGRFPTESEIHTQFKHLVAIAESIEKRDAERANTDVRKFIAHVQRYYRDNDASSKKVTTARKSESPATASRKARKD